MLTLYLLFRSSTNILILFILQIISAKNIAPVDCEVPPDSYVKCYIKDGERLRHKKKTRIIRHSYEPHYRQIIKYQVTDL